MAKSEQQPHSPAEVAPPIQIGLIRDGENQITVWKREDALVVEYRRNDQLVGSTLFSTVVFDASLHSPPPATEPEKDKTPEHPPITIEGYVARTPAYRDSRHTDHKGEKELFFPISYRPDLENNTWVIWYDIYVYGAHAAELDAKKAPPKGKAVRIQGTDHSHEIKKRTGEGEETKIKHIVHADSVRALNTKPRPMQGKLEQSDSEQR